MPKVEALNPDLPVQVAADRRRPGRMAQVNPNLLPLLRGEAVVPRDSVVEADPDWHEADDMRPARGVAFAVWVSLIFWVVCIGLVWALV